MHSNNACCLFGVLFELLHMSPRPSPAHLAALVHSIVCVCVCVCMFVCSHIPGCVCTARRHIPLQLVPRGALLLCRFSGIDMYVLHYYYLLSLCVCSQMDVHFGLCRLSDTYTLTHTHSLSLFTFVSTRTHIHPVSFRMQIDPSSTDFKDMLIERCFAEYMICNFILFIATINYIG